MESIRGPHLHLHPFSLEFCTCFSTSQRKNSLLAFCTALRILQHSVSRCSGVYLHTSSLFLDTNHASYYLTVMLSTWTPSISEMDTK